MAGKGAPKGNKYASKEVGERERGIAFTYYLDAYEYEFLQQSVKYDGQEPTDAKVRVKARKVTKQALTEEMQRVFARYKAEKQA